MLVLIFFENNSSILIGSTSLFQIPMLATIENNHYESGEKHQKKSKRKSHYYNNSKGSTIVLANNAQKIGANE